MARLFRWFVVLSALIAIAAVSVVGYGYTRFVRPGPLAGDLVVIVPRGTGVDGIARILESQGVIEDELVFRLGVRALGESRPLQAGEYEFPRSVSPRGAMEILQGGKRVVRRLTVPEGLTTYEVLDRVAKTEGLMGPITVKPGEGELLPETYHFSYGDSRDEIVRRMQSSMQTVVSELWARRSGGALIDTPRKAVILASIVEKETGRPEERAKVAGVFINRLRTGMRLQSDPTVVYAVTGGKTVLDRPLSQKDLEAVSPFNTYLNAGLPPAPIANPGRASLEAAIYPAESGDLYFVADGNGGHAFARTLAEHNQNVARWRALMKTRNAE
jgi:UPF0755 protein